MPTNRRYIRRPSRSRITPDQEMDLWLGAGPQGNPRLFASQEARQAAWLRHRHLFIGKLPSSPGRRPAAWWEYDSPIRYRGYDRERSILYEAGMLGDGERIALEAEWRHEFDRAQKPDFAYCAGPGPWLEGAAARRAHYQWADIPRQLVRQWTAERRRFAQTIQKLKDETSR
jgi:hypothetical protein